MLTLDALQGRPLGECGRLPPPVTERIRFALACVVSLEDPHHRHQGARVSLLHLVVVWLSFCPLVITSRNSTRKVGFGIRTVILMRLLH